MSKAKQINGDNTSLSYFDKLKYLTFHFLIYFKSVFQNSELTTTKINVNNSALSKNNSPIRDSIDSFFNDFFKKYPNNNISVLDIGCGSGYVFQKLTENHFSGKYIGLDIKLHSDFKKLSSEIMTKEFIEGSAENIDINDKFDLIISVTALEHIEDDKLALNNIQSFLKPKGEQVHVLPAGSTIFLYLLHGWRQYNLGMIHQLFKKEVFITVHESGGPLTFLFHFLFITIFRMLGIDYKKINIFFYSIKKLVVRLDNYLKIFPSLYVVVCKKRDS
jgi:ubiquinone/menaquinone biosynthesis C-methylase UbiE